MNDIELTLGSEGGHIDLVTEVPLEVSGTGVELSLSTTPYIGGNRNYEKLTNKPSIESVELVGDKKLTEFGVSAIGNAAILDLFR